MASLLIIDDNEMMRDSLRITLSRAGHDVTACASPHQALETLTRQRPQVVITDLKMPKMDGIELLSRIRAAHPDLPVILMTAFATINTAVQAMRQGAFDYIQKPFDGEEIQVVIERALQHAALVAENQAFRANAEAAAPRDLVGESAAMREVRARIAQVAGSGATVLISGESGTGKEVVAQWIHNHSPRAGRPMVALNCAAIQSGLLESELFGHEKGAFTGADRLRKGRFELADGSTLLLDEISEIDPSVQAKLLRVLQERAFERVGSSLTQQVDVRVIATTNRNLAEWVRQGKFRDDLYYRLNVVPIHLPPLRQRVEDIPALCQHFLARIAARDGRPMRVLETAALDLMLRYRWPGNVRELENICERFVVLEPGERLRAETIAPWLSGEHCLPRVPDAGATATVSAESPTPAKGLLEDLERDTILRVLQKHRGHRQKSATELGIGLRTLGLKIKRLKDMGVAV